MPTLLAALLLGPGLLTACSGDPVEDYCAEVEDQREPLSEVTSEGGPTALLEALPAFEELRQASPTDLRDDWDVVVDRLTALDDALARAGVDPATYDAEEQAGDLAEDERTAVESAARQLATPEMVRALEAVQQQARDVCGTSLTI
ncbi:conserved hypothetical protein [Nocardioides sp. AX2bis]|nr:conserved hypothetical protein [Nocardioides sp. AX2bis]